MTTWLLKTLYGEQDSLRQDNLSLQRYHWILLSVFVSLLFLKYWYFELFNLIANTFSDAYLGVSIFVAVTLAGFYLLDRLFKANLTSLLNQRSLLQVPVAAFLGALPGCGGAIIVVMQFVHGKMSFGALVAVLISTMGDAAFLLLATKPEIALVVYGLSMTAGIIFGYIINLIHGYDYMKSDTVNLHSLTAEVPKISPMLIQLFLVLLVPGSILGLLGAFQLNTDALFGPLAALEPTKWIGFMGAMVCLAVWMSQPLNSWSARFAKKDELFSIRETVVAETSFISVWVIIGFVLYELVVHFMGLDLQAQFMRLGMFGPLLAIVIGFIPGCGPQILVTSLYINGVVPLSSLLANAISNDGDALFPAIALAPKAAIKATIYSAIPAFLLGYTAFFLGW